MCVFEQHEPIQTGVLTSLKCASRSASWLPVISKQRFGREGFWEWKPALTRLTLADGPAERGERRRRRKRDGRINGGEEEREAIDGDRRGEGEIATKIIPLTSRAAAIIKLSAALAA